MNQEDENRKVFLEGLAKDMQDAFRELGKHILDEPKEFAGLSCKGRSGPMKPSRHGPFLKINDKKLHCFICKKKERLATS